MGLSSKVTVIIPAYNIRSYIGDALISLEQQSLQEFEAIVVDDGSTDGTSEVVQPFCQRDPRFRLIFKPNGGLSSARNYGIRHARTDYIALLDGDDIYAPNKLANHVERLDRDPHIGVVYSASKIIRDDGQLTWMSLSGKPIFSDPLLSLLCKNFVGHGSNAVFRRVLIDEVGEFDETLRSSEDVDFWLRVAATGRWHFYREPCALSYYRVRPSGLSFNVAQMQHSHEQVLQAALQRSPEKIEPHLPTAYAHMYRFLARLSITAGDTEQARQFVQQAWSADRSIFYNDPRSLLTLIAVQLAPLAKQMIGRSLGSAKSILESKFMKATSLLKSGFWISYATFVTRIFSFLSSLVLARLLQPSDFGVIGIAYVFWSFFTLFTQDTAGTFIVYKGTDNPKYVNTTYTISLLIGLVFGLGMVVTSPFVAKFFNEPALLWILIAFSFNLVMSSGVYVYASVMTRQMQYRSLANISLVASLVRLSCTTIAALLGLSYWSFVIGDTASWIVNGLLTRHYSRHDFRLEIDPKIKSEVLSFCLGATGSSFGFYINANVDNFTVGKVLGSASLGYYNLAYQLTMALSTIFNSVISQLGMPIFAQLEDDKQQEKALFNVVEKIAFLTAPIYALIFLIFDPQVVTLVFGAKWIPICTVIPGLLIFAYFRVINTPLNTMLAAKGRPDVNAKVNLQIAPVAVLSFIFGAYQGGIVGVSLAVALVLGLGWTVYWWWVGCRTLHWSLQKFFFPCFVPVLLTIPGILLSFHLPLLLRPFVFLLVHLVFMRVFVYDQLLQYQALLAQVFDRVMNRFMRFKHSK